MTFGHTVRVITIPLLLVAAGCVPQDGAPKAASAAVPPALAQQSAAPAVPLAPATSAPATKITTDLTVPRSSTGTATYRCGNGDMITIQSLGTSLRAVGRDGVAEEFAASPANQTSRYQAATHDAIVIDGREALVMKKGSTPQTCKR
ncbi:hypothetical protein FJ930_17450 [Mesorhizobium sp. B2-4-15]|uniref:hypothetical protein n=1 Tax=unclassified Mesorhizobium TaxID=325217 RepID=UPI00112736C3|nr:MULTISPECIES: hypothetical protein [unclassified Mesorhizobium]TPK70518.1 hypothetical protein FJ930_17450 [Mesorhizobium sp. B2-4-15]TPM35255.1 hypothetical protein FJ958_04860 [Mesorhizobium sp. B2-3-5]